MTSNLLRGLFTLILLSTSFFLFAQTDSSGQSKEITKEAQEMKAKLNRYLEKGAQFSKPEPEFLVKASVLEKHNRMLRELDSLRALVKKQQAEIAGLRSGEISVQGTSRKAVANCDGSDINRCIYFDKSSAVLTVSGKQKIQQQMDQIQNRKIELHCYTDAYGAVDFNQSLANKRGASVKEMLIKAGIPEDSIVIVNHGGEPVKGKASHCRRVEICTN